jgi:hypothetical protein
MARESSDGMSPTRKADWARTAGAANALAAKPTETCMNVRRV